MADKEYVIKCLKYLHDRETWKEGPLVSDDHATDRRQITADALSLLLKQEPLTIHDPGAICPNCKWPLYPEDHPNYCGNCGRAVKWDD